MDICNVDAVGQLCAGDNTGIGALGIVAICAYNSTVLVGDCNDVSLQVLLEVVGLTVVDNTADRILVIIQRNQNILISLRNLIIVPALTQDLGAIQDVIMLDTCDRLADSDAVGSVGVGVAVKGLKLAALLPGQCMTQIGGGIALGVIDDGLLVGTVSVYSNFSSMSNQ